MEAELQEILQQKVLSYRDLLSLGRGKQEALAKGQIRELEVLLAAEEGLIGRLGQLDTQRRTKVLELSERYSFDPEAPLQEWVDRLPPEQATALRRSREELLQLAGQVEELSRLSQPVIIQWLRFLERAQEFWRSGPASVYGPTGDLQGSAGSRSLDHRA